jgi:MFS family permease
MDYEEATSEGRPVAAASAVRSGTFASLSLPQFKVLLVGTGAAQVANWMETVARGWLVQDLTGSPFQLGFIAFVYGISSLVFSPVAGVLTDRVNRRALAMTTQLLSGGIALALGVLVVTDSIQLWQVYAAAVVSGISAAVNMPVRQALLYDIVGNENLTNAIALNSVTANISRIAAPTFGGGIIAATGIGEAYFTEAAFLLIATLATFSLKITHAAQRVHIPMWQGVREGFDYVRKEPVLARLVVLNAIPSVLIYPYVSLMPIFADDILHAGSTGYGILLSAVGFGSIPGGLVMANMSRNKGRIMAIAAMVYMGLVAAFAYSELIWLSFAILVFAGVGWSMMAILNQILLQLQIADDNVRGRVLAFYTMSNGLTPFGSLTMGAMADATGVQAAVAAFALTGFVLAGYLGLGSERIRELK